MGEKKRKGWGYSASGEMTKTVQKKKKQSGGGGAGEKRQKDREGIKRGDPVTWNHHQGAGEER